MVESVLQEIISNTSDYRSRERRLEVTRQKKERFFAMEVEEEDTTMAVVDREREKGDLR